METLAETKLIESKLIGLPFKITRDDAKKIIVSNKKLLELSKDVHINDNDIEEYFVPFYGASFDHIMSSFNGKYGIDRLKIYKSYKYDPVTGKYVYLNKFKTIIKWNDVFGILLPTNYPLGTINTQIYTGITKYPQNEIENAFDMHEDDFDFFELKNERSVPIIQHNITENNAIEELKNKIKQCETNRAKEYLVNKFNANHTEINDLNVNFKNSKIDANRYHFPVYVYKYKHNDVEYYKFVNGNTGKYSGEYVISPTKTFCISSAIGVAICIALGPISTTGCVLSGLALGFSSVIYTKFQTKKRFLQE